MSNNATCYKGDGTESNDIPCGFSSISQCCGEGWDCLTNGLCRDHGTTAYSQGTCTDPSFINCLAFCNDGTCTFSSLWAFPWLLGLRQTSWTDQFKKFTEVSRCDQNGNSWCCAGPAGQGLGGEDCCETNLTTSLEPYPLSTIERTRKSETIVTSLSTTALTSTSSSFSLTKSLAPTGSQTSVVSPSTSTSKQPADQNHDSTRGVKIGVPIAVIIVAILACLVFLIFRKNRAQKRGLVELQGGGSEDPLSVRPMQQELEGHTAWELDVTHYELSHPNTPRHELS